MSRKVIAFVMLAAASWSNGQDGDWFPAPDGFVWPARVTKQPAKDEQARVADMPEALRDYVAEQWKPQPLPEFIHARRADLNGDGVVEWFIDIPILGGTGGCFYEIITQTTKGLRSLGGIQGGFHLCVPVKGEKWLQIEGSSRAGGGDMTRYLMQFRKTEYINVRSEVHDYNAGKATVGK